MPESISWKNGNTSNRAHFPTSLLLCQTYRRVAAFRSWEPSHDQVPWVYRALQACGIILHSQCCHLPIFQSMSSYTTPAHLYFHQHLFRSPPLFNSLLFIFLSLIFNRFSPYPLLIPLLPSFTWILPALLQCLRNKSLSLLFSAFSCTISHSIMVYVWMKTWHGFWNTSLFDRTWYTRIIKKCKQ